MSIVATGIGAVIAGVATKIGAGLVKEAVAGKLGGTAGDLAGIVVDKIAGKLGLPVDKVETAEPKALETAVREVEADMPAILAGYLELQREANRLQLAEMDKAGPTWTWAWRPAWMWGLLVGWAWYLMLVPLINLAVRLAGGTEQIVLIVDIATLLSVTFTYTGLYMGGHTVKDGITKIWGKKVAA